MTAPSTDSSSSNANTAPKQPLTLKLSTDFVSPVNAVMVASLALLDLAAPALDHWSARVISLLLAAFAIFLLWTISRAMTARAPGEPVRAVWRQVLRSKALWCAAAVILAGGGLLLARPSNAGANVVANVGALAAHVPGADRLQALLLGVAEDTHAMRGDVKAIREAMAPSDARGQLRTLGYGLDDESKARAIESCDLPALRLYVAAGERLPLAVPVFGVRGGSVLEKPLLARDERLPEVLDLLAGQGMNFDQPYMLTFTQANTGRIPQFDQLAKKVPAAQRLGFMPTYVFANALTLALWFDHGPAARKLVALGARRDVGVEALLPQTDARGNVNGGMAARPIASAADEARRLQHAEWLQ